MKAVRIASWVLIFVAIGATAASWIPSLDIDEDDAERVALGAMRAGGYEDAVVNGPIVFDENGRLPDPGPDANRDDGDDANDADDANNTDDGNDGNDGNDEGNTAPQSVWIVPVEVDDEQIEFRLDTRGQLLFVDDLIGDDKADRFFSDEEWEDVRHFDAGILSDWITRNVAGSVAAMLIVSNGFVISKRSDLFTERPATTPVPAVTPTPASSPTTRGRARARTRSQALSASGGEGTEGSDS